MKKNIGIWKGWCSWWLARWFFGLANGWMMVGWILSWMDIWKVGGLCVGWITGWLAGWWMLNYCCRWMFPRPAANIDQTRLSCLLRRPHTIIIVRNLINVIPEKLIHKKSEKNLFTASLCQLCGMICDIHWTYYFLQLVGIPSGKIFYLSLCHICCYMCDQISLQRSPISR